MLVGATLKALVVIVVVVVVKIGKSVVDAAKTVKGLNFILVLVLVFVLLLPVPLGNDE